MEQQKTGLLQTVKNKINAFLHEIKEYRRKSELRCPHCFRTGHEEEAKFCKYCGGKLDE